MIVQLVEHNDIETTKKHTDSLTFRCALQTLRDKYETKHYP